MKTALSSPEVSTFYICQVGGSCGDTAPRAVLHTPHFSRSQWDCSDGTARIIDHFDGDKAASCSFLRFTSTKCRTVKLAVRGSHQLTACSLGGWLLEPTDISHPTYWIPRPPLLRAFDAHNRILVEQPASIGQLEVSASELAVSILIPEGMYLDLVFWRLSSAHLNIHDELKTVYSLERHPTFLWSSKTVCASPADVYLHLIHGHVYQNAPAWPRQWKFCCELDAFELYVWLSGLDLATGKKLYNYIRRQLVLSIIARQSKDGGWYHGEWTDMKESHYRFHNGALLLLENALDEWPDDVLHEHLLRGATFVASHTDQTDLGLWFLHDSLEDSAEKLDEMHKQTGALAKGHGAWRRSHFLGKSATNKMILNTHLDTCVTLARYQEVSGDNRFSQDLASALAATRAALTLHAGEALYRLIYLAIGLTLLPEATAKNLPLWTRALKRLTWMYVTPNLYRVKHIFPRFVMPNGFIERHLSPLHFEAKYHAVNVMDLVRYWRRFPEEDVATVIDNAIQFVLSKDQGVLRWWGERKPRQFAIVVFAEALYHLYMLTHNPTYREYLALVLLCIEDYKLGLPPSLFGGNSEILPRSRQIPCPIPGEPRLRIANLSSAERKDFLVVNPTHDALKLSWQRNADFALRWKASDGTAFPTEQPPKLVPPRSWLVGLEASAE